MTVFRVRALRTYRLTLSNRVTPNGYNSTHSFRSDWVTSVACRPNHRGRARHPEGTESAQQEVQHPLWQFPDDGSKQGRCRWLGMSTGRRWKGTVRLLCAAVVGYWSGKPGQHWRSTEGQERTETHWGMYSRGIVMWSEYCGQPSVCLRAYLWNRWTDPNEILCAFRKLTSIIHNIIRNICALKWCSGCR